MFSAKGLKKMAAKATGLGNSSNDELEDEDGDVFHDAAEAVLHPDAAPADSGGLACNDMQLLSRQRRQARVNMKLNAIMGVVKSLGKNLLSGHLDLLKVSLPVAICEPRSYLQKLADPWVYPTFLCRAAETTDPVERLQWVVTFIIAGLHRAFLHFEKPFNPILGETYEASLSDGSRIYLEQISHHPPISAFELEGPGGRYVFRGLSQPSVSYKTSGGVSIKTVARGYRHVEFADGGRIEVTYPHYYVKGLLLNAAPRADIAGEAVFTDAAHGLTATIRFGSVEGAASELLRRPDALSGEVVREVHLPKSASSPGGLDHASLAAKRRPASSSFAGLVRSSMTLGLAGKGSRQGKGTPVLERNGSVVVDTIVLATCSGNWLSHLDWGGERRWTLAEDAPEEWDPLPAPLPSDARYREDLAALAAGDLLLAQRAKEALEQRQRADAKLRKEGHAAATKS